MSDCRIENTERREIEKIFASVLGYFFIEEGRRQRAGGRRKTALVSPAATKGSNGLRPPLNSYSVASIQEGANPIRVFQKINDPKPVIAFA
jgi:hypothetical protein